VTVKCNQKTELLQDREEMKKVAYEKTETERIPKARGTVELKKEGRGETCKKMGEGRTTSISEGENASFIEIGNTKGH